MDTEPTISLLNKGSIGLARKYPTNISNDQGSLSEHSKLYRRPPDDSFQNLFGIHGYGSNPQNWKNNAGRGALKNLGSGNELTSPENCRRENAMNNNTCTTSVKDVKAGRQGSLSSNDSDSSSGSNLKDTNDCQTLLLNQMDQLGMDFHGLHELDKIPNISLDNKADPSWNSHRDGKHSKSGLIRPFSITEDDVQEMRHEFYDIGSLSQPLRHEASPDVLPLHPSISSHLPSALRTNTSYDRNLEALQRRCYREIQNESPVSYLPSPPQSFVALTPKQKGIEFPSMNFSQYYISCSQSLGMEPLISLQKPLDVSLDECRCINPGSSHACSSRVSSYGILNPLFDETLRCNILEGKGHLTSKLKNNRTQNRLDDDLLLQGSDSSSSDTKFKLKDLHPNHSYYVPYDLTSFKVNDEHGNESTTDERSSRNSIGLTSESDPVADRSSLYKSRSLTSKEMESSELKLLRNDNMKKNVSEHPQTIKKKKTSQKIEVHVKPCFISPGSGEITLPYTPQDMQEELMYPDIYAMDSEIIQNLNAHEDDFVLGKPTRKPSSNLSVQLVRDTNGKIRKIRNNQDVNKSRYKIQNSDTSLNRMNTSKIDSTGTKLISEMNKLDELQSSKKDPTYISRVPADQRKRLVDKRHSLPVDIPLKLDNFDRDEYVKFKKHLQSTTSDLPGCLRLHCLDTCQETTSSSLVGDEKPITSYSSAPARRYEGECKDFLNNLELRRSSDSKLFDFYSPKESVSTGKITDSSSSRQDESESRVDRAGARSATRKLLLAKQRSIFQEGDEMDADESEVAGILRNETIKNSPNDISSTTNRDKTSKKINSEDHASAISESNKEYKFGVDKSSKLCETNMVNGELRSVCLKDFITDKQCRKSDLAHDKLHQEVIKDSHKPMHPDEKDLQRFHINYEEEKLKSNCNPEGRMSQQSSFNSDDGSCKADSGSQDSSDNSAESRSSASLYERRMKGGKLKNKLKIDILDGRDKFSFNTESNGVQLGLYPREVEEKEAKKLSSLPDVVEKARPKLLTSLLDDPANYWLDNTSPNTAALGLNTQSPPVEACNIVNEAKGHNLSLRKFLKDLDSTEPPKLKKKSSKHKKHSNRSNNSFEADSPCGLIIFENPTSIANFSPDAEAMLTSEIVSNIIQEKKSRSQTNSVSSTTETHPVRSSTELSQDEFLPYRPLPAPCTTTPGGDAFQGGCTALVPDEDGGATSLHEGVSARSSDISTGGTPTGTTSCRRLCPAGPGVATSCSSCHHLHANIAGHQHLHHRHHARRESRHHRTPPSSSASSTSSSSDEESSSSSESSSDSSSSDTSSDSSSDLEDLQHLRM